MTTNAGHKLCVDTLSSELYDDSHTEKIKSCGTLASNRKAMTMIVGNKLKLKCSDKGGG
jgi:hypothetical protein